MPIRFTTVDRQRSLAAVARAVYDIGNEPEALERAVAALRRANPHARDDSALASGMTLVVPDLRRLRPAGTANDVPVDTTQRTALERAEALRRVTDRSLARAVDEAKRWEREVAADVTLEAIIKTRPDLRDKLPFFREDAGKRVERIAAAGQAFGKTMDEVLKALKAQG
jgi:hypothetical protein